MPATTNKQHLLNLVLTALKKKFPAPPEPDKRAVLDEVVYAICRENVPTRSADEAYAKIRVAFFDWNEVRVSTVQEVADVLVSLPGAGDRAKRIIEFLQEHFERTYSFELDDLEKKGLKQAAKQLARYKDKGVNDFVVAWVTQRSLGGHAVPLDDATIRVLRRLHVIEGDIDDMEATRASLEHYVSKANGYEFTEELIQLANAVCVEGTPHCTICPLKTECPTGIANTAKPTKADKGDGKTKPKSR